MNDLITASPLIVGDFDWDLSKAVVNKSKKEDLLKRKSLKPLREFSTNKVSVYTTENGTTGVVFAVDEISGYLAYYVSFVRKRLLNGNNAIRQIKVWRGVSLVLPHNFTALIFFKYLLPKYGSLVSDESQTEAGKRFWLNRIRDAVQDTHLYSYALDIKTQKWFEITEKTNIQALEQDFWGTSGTRTKLLAISNEPW